VLGNKLKFSLTTVLCARGRDQMFREEITSFFSYLNSPKMVVASQLFLYANELLVISAFFAALQTACFAGVTIIERRNTARAVRPYITEQ